ncbi:unannotated protein [freshwater metagenome]|uniref:Unannotated protein n=1 Tax=freshwater metagenome TaxID=449393 RepID=A0A6J7EE38_9ZZZZ
MTTSDPTLHPTVLVIQNDPTDPPLLAGEWLGEAGLRLELVEAWSGGPCPTAVPASVSGILVLGGTPNAHDDIAAPWLPAVRALMADAVDNDVPVLGLCLGGQLLAAALGGRVELSANTEVGLVYVERTEAGLLDPVMAQIDAPGDRIPATQWHQDQIVELPEGALVLLTNPACRVQAFRYGASAYGLQMHPEIDARAFDEWATEVDDALLRSGTTGAQAAAEVRLAQGPLVAAWRPMILAWADLVWAYATDRR